MPYTERTGYTLSNYTNMVENISKVRLVINDLGMYFEEYLNFNVLRS